MIYRILGSPTKKKQDINNFEKCKLKPKASKAHDKIKIQEAKK